MIINIMVLRCDDERKILTYAKLVPISIYSLTGRGAQYTYTRLLRDSLWQLSLVFEFFFETCSVGCEF